MLQCQEICNEIRTLKTNLTFLLCLLITSCLKYALLCITFTSYYSVFVFSWISLTMVFNLWCCILLKVTPIFFNLLIVGINKYIRPKGHSLCTLLFYFSTQTTKWLFILLFPKTPGITLVLWVWGFFLLPKLVALQILPYYFSLHTQLYLRRLSIILRREKYP